MKKLIVLVILGISVLYMNEGLFGQTEPSAELCTLLQNNPNPFEEITTIRFKVNSDCFVRLFVTNEQSGAVTLLVKGEMGIGENGVIFKTPNRPESSSHNEQKYLCTLEAIDGTGIQHCEKFILMQQGR